MVKLATTCLLLIIFGVTDVAAQSSTTNALDELEKVRMSFSDYSIVETYDIKLTQTWLKTLGYFKGKPDGKFDQKTVKAIKRYQKDKGFKVDGKLDHELLMFIEADARGPFAPRVALQ